jgi:hypothetical protein
MHLAYEYKARQVWVVNVGDLKPMEFPISFFLDYAWSPDKWPANRLAGYTKLWAAQQFGTEHAAEIADMLTLYTKYNGRRKPELLDQNTYSLVNYREFENEVNDYNKLNERAQQLYKLMPPQYKDAYYQLVLHPVEACANLNEMYFAAARNKLYATQGRSATNQTATEVQQLFEKDAEISHYYNKVLAGGKWDHMMDQTHIGYTYWQQPPVDKMPDVAKIDLPASPQMGIAVEGSTGWWPNEHATAVLPGFYSGQGGHYIELFNRGQGSFNFKVETTSPYLAIEPAGGVVNDQQRIEVTVKWQKVPAGIHTIPIIITGLNRERAMVEAVINNTLPPPVNGFNENNGYVSMEAAHYTKAVDAPAAKWMLIPNYGRTLSGMMPSPVTAESQSPGGNSPHLEYEVNLIDTGVMNVEAYISPTIDFTNSTGLHYAISFDDEQPQVININADKSEAAWNKDVSDNIKMILSKHHLQKAGRHVLKYWMVDPGVVLQKIVINAGGEKPSYLGPPESVFVIK